MKSQQLIDRNFRAAVALNNIAVSLMSRRSYREARETIKDGISIINNVFENRKCYATSQDNDAGFAAEFPSGQVDGKVDKACKYLAAGCCRPPPSTSAISPASYDGFTLHDAETSSFATPIHLDPLVCDCREERDLELVVGIMLHNFGVAYVCLLSLVQQTRPNVATRLGNIAMRLFKDGFTTIHGSMSSGTGFPADNDVLRIDRIVINHMVQTHSRLGNLSEANACYRYMVQIQELQTMLERCSIEDMITAPAA